QKIDSEESSFYLQYDGREGSNVQLSLGLVIRDNFPKNGIVLYPNEGIYIKANTSVYVKGIGELGKIITTTKITSGSSDDGGEKPSSKVKIVKTFEHCSSALHDDIEIGLPLNFTVNADDGYEFTNENSMYVYVNSEWVEIKPLRDGVKFISCPSINVELHTDILVNAIATKQIIAPINVSKPNNTTFKFVEVNTDKEITNVMTNTYCEIRLYVDNGFKLDGNVYIEYPLYNGNMNYNQSGNYYYTTSAVEGFRGNISIMANIISPVEVETIFENSELEGKIHPLFVRDYLDIKIIANDGYEFELIEIYINGQSFKPTSISGTTEYSYKEKIMSYSKIIIKATAVEIADDIIVTIPNNTRVEFWDQYEEIKYDSIVKGFPMTIKLFINDGYKLNGDYPPEIVSGTSVTYMSSYGDIYKTINVYTEDILITADIVADDITVIIDSSGNCIVNIVKPVLIGVPIISTITANNGYYFKTKPDITVNNEMVHYVLNEDKTIATIPANTIPSSKKPIHIYANAIEVPPKTYAKFDRLIGPGSDNIICDIADGTLLETNKSHKITIRAKENFRLWFTVNKQYTIENYIYQGTTANKIYLNPSADNVIANEYTFTYTPTTTDNIFLYVDSSIANCSISNRDSGSEYDVVGDLNDCYGKTLVFNFTANSGKAFVQGKMPCVYPSYYSSDKTYGNVSSDKKTAIAEVLVDGYTCSRGGIIVELTSIPDINMTIQTEEFNHGKWDISYSQSSFNIVAIANSGYVFNKGVIFNIYVNESMYTSVSTYSDGNETVSSSLQYSSFENKNIKCIIRNEPTLISEMPDVIIENGNSDNCIISDISYNKSKPSASGRLSYSVKANDGFIFAKTLSPFIKSTYLDGSININTVSAPTNIFDETNSSFTTGAAKFKLYSFAIPSSTNVIENISNIGTNYSIDSNDILCYRGFIYISTNDVFSDSNLPSITINGNTFIPEIGVSIENSSSVNLHLNGIKNPSEDIFIDLKTEQIDMSCNLVGIKRTV
ncbi:MAG: hypothetical protein ACRC42_03890, partial [Mycoplasma sp.]